MILNYRKLKELAEVNWYIGDCAARILGYSYNKKMEEFVDRISQIDSITDIQNFYNMMKEVPEAWHGSYYTYKRIFSENTLYGYAHEILKYAGLSDNQIFYMPLLQHGIPYGVDLDLSRLNRNSAYIFQGRAGQEIWEANIPKEKAYYVGPYIHYSQSYYTKSQMKSLKHQLGKTLLLFLPHSCEFESMSIHLNDIIEKYEKTNHESIDTIIACIYYADLTQELIDWVNKQSNFRLVCSGFKLDSNFVRRLRTILELADNVIFNSFSSSIGYAYYLGKNIICDIDDDELKQCFDSYGEDGKVKLVKFKELFDNSDVTDQAKYAFINHYWGIEDIKTPVDMRKIIKENKYKIISHLGF